MTRISRTAALSAAAILALGIAACSPPNQKNSDAPQITTVNPDSGYTGAGQPTGHASESASAGAGEIVDEGAAVTTEEPAETAGTTAR